MAAPSDPAPTYGVHFFTMDKVMRYQPFCADFGPFNLGMTHHFCEVLKELMLSHKNKQTKIVYYTSPAAGETTNAIYLLGAFMVLHLGATPDEAWAPFSNLHGAVKAYRDATWVTSPYDLHVKDCWAGLKKAVSVGYYDVSTFDDDEYFYCKSHVVSSATQHQHTTTSPQLNEINSCRS
jgi:cell division cycle 14